MGSVFGDVDFFEAAGDQEDGALADVGGAVADAFEVVAAPEHVGDRVEVGGVAVDAGEALDQAAVEIGVEVVYLIILVAGGASERLIAVEEGAGGVAEHFAREVGHAPEVGLGGISNYQEWDKWVDQVYILLFLVVAWRWTGLERNIALGLFAYRLVGFIAFLGGAGRELLIFFPNVFEFWFLYVASRPHWPARWVGKVDGVPPPLDARTAVRWLLILTALKVFHEYVLHTGKWLDDFTALDAVDAIWDFLSGPF